MAAMVNKLKPPFVLCALFMFAPVTHALQVSVAGLDGNPCNFPSIQTAIDAAVQAGGSHVVYVNSDLGSHAENVVIPDGAEVSIFAAASCQTPTSGVLRWTPQDLATSQIAVGRNARVEVFGFVLDGAGSLVGEGGLARVLGGSLTLSSCDISKYAANDGGAVWLRGFAEEPAELILMAETQIHDCAAAFNGGAVFAETDPSAGTQRTGVILSSGAIVGGSVGNSATFGGGIYLNGASLEVGDDASVALNHALDGGGVYVESLTYHSSVHLRGSALIGENLASQNGGGLFVEGTGIQVLAEEDAAILGNTAGVNGGGIYAKMANVIGGLSTLPIQLLDRTALSSNEALTGSGGGAFLHGAALQIEGNDPLAYLRVDTNTAGGNGAGIHAEEYGFVDIHGLVSLSSNFAGGDGGGLAATLGSWVRLKGNRFAWDTQGSASGSIELRGNEARNGGGLYLSGGRLEVKNAIFDQNRAGLDGGGLFLTGLAVAKVRNAIVHDNEAQLQGGGLRVVGAQLDLRSNFGSCDPSLAPFERYCSEIYDNVSLSDVSDEGGGGISTSSDSYVRMETTALRNNTALGRGLALLIEDSRVRISDSLIFDHALSPDAVGSSEAVFAASDARLRVRNSTVARNLDVLPIRWEVDPNGAHALGSLTNSIVHDNLGALVWGGPGHLPGRYNIGDLGSSMDPALNNLDGVDPILVPGLRTDFMPDPLLSAAVDASPSGSTIDLVNVARPAGAGIDMGAFEQ